MSNMALEFKEQWLPYLLTFFVAFGGTSVGNLVIKTIFDKSLNLLGLTKDKLERAKEDVNKSNLDNLEVKKVIEEKMNFFIEKIILLQEELKLTKDELQKAQEDYSNSRIEQEKTIQTILEVLKIAFLNNEDLVKKGYAIEIAKVLGEK